MFKIEFYDSGQCQRCKKVSNIHLARTSRERSDRDYIDLCWGCWTYLDSRVKRQVFTNSQVKKDAEKTTQPQ